MLVQCVAVLLSLGPITARPSIVRDDKANTRLMDPQEVSQWTLPAYYASAAYCPDYTIQQWDCGVACENSTKPTSIITGGNGKSTPRWYVAKQPDGGIILAISGTNTSSPESIGIDLDFPLVKLPLTDFPNSDGSKVHSGFLGAFKRIKDDVGLAVEQFGGREVTVVGHSMGGAVGLIMATYLAHQYPGSVTSVKLFGTPRVGNDKWADYVESTLGDTFSLMINYADNVPHVPPREWKYTHPSGEIFISQHGNQYIQCSGRENKACARGSESLFGTIIRVATFIEDLDGDQHLGPYAGVV